ncbi:hypothetical protein SERLA73DRAFT_130527, partial [Serpula lacrymans var. lacrymans S7.3]
MAHPSARILHRRYSEEGQSLSNSDCGTRGKKGEYTTLRKLTHAYRSRERIYDPPGGDLYSMSTTTQTC